MFQVLSGKPAEESGDGSQKSVDFGPDQREPVDLAFVKNFTAAGGKFLFCESEKEAHHFLREIAGETGIHRIFCEDANSRSILQRAGIRDLSENRQTADAFCTPCEFLVSFTGGIMLCEKQMRGVPLKDLPDIFIVLARTSQIVSNLRAALMGIRRKYDGGIPSHITTIKGPEAEQDANVCRKEIYLLLIEDQL